MKKIFLNLILIVILTNLSGCSIGRSIKETLVPNNVVKVNSAPQAATVSIYDPFTNNYIKQGVTPLVIEENSKLSEAIRDADVWAIAISRRGYVVEHILFDRRTNPKFELYVKLKLNADWADKDDSLVSDIADKIGRSIQAMNKNINSGRLGTAMTLVKEMIKEFPKAAIFFDIKGSIHVLRGEVETAIASFRKSLQLRPQSVETRAALDSLLRKQRKVYD